MKTIGAIYPEVVQTLTDINSSAEAGSFIDISVNLNDRIGVPSSLFENVVRRCLKQTEALITQAICILPFLSCTINIKNMVI